MSGGTSVGGFVAYPANSPTVSFCYWDTQASGLATGPLAASRTTVEMTHPHTPNTYEEWDFASVWQTDASGINAGYPLLRESEVRQDWYLTHAIAPAEGQTWADLDASDRFGKGMTLLDEFLADTDPNHPLSRFVTGKPVLSTATTVEIHFQPSSPARRYTLWRSTNLAHWLPVPGQTNVPGGSGPLVDDAPPVGKAFYRVTAGLP